MTLRNKNGRLEKGELRVDIDGAQAIFDGLHRREKTDPKRVTLKARSNGKGIGQIVVSGMVAPIQEVYELSEMTEEEFNKLNDCFENEKRITVTWVERDTGRMKILNKAVIAEPLDEGSQEADADPENIRLVVACTRENYNDKKYQ